MCFQTRAGSRIGRMNVTDKLPREIEPRTIPEGIRQEALLRGLFSKVPEAVVLLDIHDRILKVNPEFTKIFGYAQEEACGHLINELVVPEELSAEAEEYTRRGLRGESLNVETVRKHKDGKRVHVSMISGPVSVADGHISHYAIYRDITKRKRAEQRLRESEAYLAEAQRLSQTGSWAWNPATGDIRYCSEMCCRVLGFDHAGPSPRFEELFQRVHPDDQAASRERFEKGIRDKEDFEWDYRIVHPEKGIRDIHTVGRAVLDGSSNLAEFVGTVIDVTERKRREQELRQSEVELRTITDTIRQPIGVEAPDGTQLYANRVALDNSGLTLDEVINEGTIRKENGFLARRCHPDDINRVREERRIGLLEGVPFDLETRLLNKSGQYRWYLVQYNPLKDESGQIIRWYNTATDIDDRKRAEDRLRQSEQELRAITDSVRQFIVVLAPDGTTLYANKLALENVGFTIRDLTDESLLTRPGLPRQAEAPGALAWNQVWRKSAHPDDLNRIQAERQEGFLRGIAFEMEARLLFKTGQYRWQLFQYNPIKDEYGQIIRWYVTATDIDDRKRMEEQLRNENLVLREEIDRSSMFDEIVGSSKPIRQLLRHVEKVAPSDSTVLVLGETGTGKELIAHALHRRSRRASRAFVKVNCAAIPQSLIASELFGHEKGAFTGALQRRVGRFEAANGGTLFLDEIGELPMETQIALLRVLQEKEFERVGSNHPISVDVRLIAATNRDLPGAVAAGTFRQDLFYRLNVFPITVPPLCERSEDIPLLVEYFVSRFAKDAGKNIRHINKRTLEQLQSYHWPGNIRELQNVVERAVILCETDTLEVDDSWLIGESEDPSPKERLSALEDREVEMIKDALAETHGRISGASGAAAKLGIPRQTLESKIRRLGINKYGQKRTASK
jgi:formate hydrogenlyase transcriptional activator